MAKQNYTDESQLAKFEFIFEQASWGLVIVYLETNEISYVNPIFADMHGYDRTEMMGKNLCFCFSPESISQFLDMIERNHDTEQYSHELTHVRKDGSQFKVENQFISIANPEGKTLYRAIYCVDFDRVKKLEYEQAKSIENAEKLREETNRSKELLNAVFDRVNDGIVSLTNNWVYEYLNQRAANMLQKENPGDLIGKNIWEVYPEGVGQPFYVAYHEAMRTQKPIVFEEYYEPWDLWFENRVYPSKGGITIYFTEITERKKSEEKLEKLAHYDTLTQLPNRVLLNERLEHCISSANQKNQSLALFVLDLDHFKNVNDSFGHGAGDQLLQQVANRLTQHFKQSNCVSRLGGDEFTILLENISNQEQLTTIACELIDLLSKPWQLLNNFEVRVGTSIGISIYPQHGKSPEVLLQHADTALSQSKSAGRDRYTMYSQKLTTIVKDQVVLESKLRKAIINNELSVYYQPQIDITTQKIIGAEALVRWQPPNENLIFPDRFIPIAEATGLITDLGNWVLKETCRQGKIWRDAGLPDISLAVNLSSHQFLHGDIIHTISNILRQSEFPSNRLEIELTESSLMEREGEAIEKFNLLHRMGLKIAIDDFGTGYSSLAYLKKFPIDVLKIDKSFVDDIPSNQDDMVIATTIIAMAHTLGLKVLAEGVENQQQLEFLTQHKCDYFQGYLFSPAINAVEFEALLRKE